MSSVQCMKGRSKVAKKSLNRMKTAMTSMSLRTACSTLLLTKAMAQRRLDSTIIRAFFGELALMYNTPRAATIRATTPGVCWVLPGAVFRHIVLQSAFKKRRMYEELLNRVPILESLSAYERMSIADALRPATYADGSLILKQGDPGDEMYFVEEGEVVITMKKVGEESETELTRIKKGGYFGELALLTKHPRAASARAVGSTKLAVLDVGSFERLLGSCLEILQRNIDDYENQLKRVFGSLDNVPELRH
uniref:Cyclic nucleotide-binding domain-containing protein n=1 Tax=Schistocephalus solidus TaxID=70667 RepID=A0A0V0J8G7_SCHSO